MVQFRRRDIEIRWSHVALMLIPALILLICLIGWVWEYHIKYGM